MGDDWADMSKSTCNSRLGGICFVCHDLRDRLRGSPRHYENTPIQYTVIFHGCKNHNFLMKNCDTFLIFAQNIDRVYTLEPPH